MALPCIPLISLQSQEQLEWVVGISISSNALSSSYPSTAMTGTERSKMCFAVGLTLFPGEKALRCCGVGPATPGHESCDSKYHSFPRNFATEMRRICGNGTQGDFRQPALS